MYVVCVCLMFVGCVYVCVYRVKGQGLEDKRVAVHANKEMVSCLFLLGARFTRGRGNGVQCDFIHGSITKAVRDKRRVCCCLEHDET